MHDVAGMRRRAFGHADEHPYRRLTGDWFRLVVATVLVVLSARHAGGDGAVEKDLAQFFAALPEGMRGFFEALSRLGSLWAVAIAAHLFDAPREIVHAAFAFGLLAGLVEWWSLRRGPK